MTDQITVWQLSLAYDKIQAEVLAPAGAFFVPRKGVIMEPPTDHEHVWVQPINGLHHVCQICHWRRAIDGTLLPPDGAPEPHISEQ
jgi:hypothetical protein